MAADSQDTTDYRLLASAAILDSLDAEELADRLELLGRAQAWATLHLGDVLARLVEVLAAREVGR